MGGDDDLLINFLFGADECLNFLLDQLIEHTGKCPASERLELWHPGAESDHPLREGDRLLAAELLGIPDGILQSCTIGESIQLMEEEDSTGDIIAAILHSYKATLSLEINTAAAIDGLVNSMVTAFTDFLCQDAEVKSTKGALRTIMLTGICVPGVTS